jgi:dephospho-CoA kinase
MKFVGITGGIGSGKSLICQIFKTLNVPVFEADLQAKNLITNDITLRKQIITLLGSKAYLPDGSYNRPWVSAQVFGNPSLLQQLNSIIHPAVRNYAHTWANMYDNASFLLYEAALMNAAGDGNFFEKIIVVESPTPLRLARIKARDSRSEEEILAIIARQKSNEDFRKIANFIIKNNEKDPLLEQVLTIFKEISA